MRTTGCSWMLTLFACGTLACVDTVAQATNKGTWGGPSGRFATSYPDIKATYWFFHFKNQPGSNLAFRIKGDFPYARYFGLSIYDLDTTDVSAALLDAAIKPDTGHKNPFVAGIDRNTKTRAFTAWAVPSGSKTNRPNAFEISSKITWATLMMRVYLPDKGRSLSGGVALPTIEAFDDKTGKPIPVSKLAVPASEATKRIGKALFNAFARFRVDIRATVDKRISFYRLRFGGGFPNGDAEYLVSGLSLSANDPVAVVRFRPPTFPRTFVGGGKFSGSEEVRYWSMNVCIDKWTQILDGTPDHMLKKDKDGLITMVFGPTTVRVAAEQAGLNWLPNGTQFGQLSLWYREMVPNKNFPAQQKLVPFFDPKKPRDPQRAEHVLGEYAPTGRYYTVKGFLDALKKGGFRASHSPFGKGCAGAKGIVPQLSTFGGLPDIGNPFYGIRITKIPAGASGLYVGGGSRTTWNGNKLPMNLAGIGAQGCVLNVGLDVITPFTASAKGVAQIKSPIPADARLIGLNVFSQAFITDPGAQNAIRVSGTGGNRFVFHR